MYVEHVSSCYLVIEAVNSYFLTRHTFCLILKSIRQRLEKLQKVLKTFQSVKNYNFTPDCFKAMKLETPFKKC